MTTTAYYIRHKRSGETWAALIDDETEQVVYACGPLDYREGTQAYLDAGSFDWTWDEEDDEFFNGTNGLGLEWDFVILEPPYSGDLEE